MASIHLKADNLGLVGRRKEDQGVGRIRLYLAGDPPVWRSLKYLIWYPNPVFAVPTLYDRPTLLAAPHSSPKAVQQLRYPREMLSTV